MSPFLEFVLGMTAFRAHVKPLNERPAGTDMFATAEALWNIRTVPSGKPVQPASGQGLVVVANHPRGILDVFISGGWLQRTLGRPVRVLVNRMIPESIPAVRDNVIGVDNMSRHGAARSAVNRAALTHAVAFLRSGGVLYVCPAGQVSSWQIRSPEGWFKRTDHRWYSTFVAVAREAGVPIQPVHLSGKNRLVYRIVRLFGRTAGRIMNFREFTASVDVQTHVTVAESVGVDVIDAHSDDDISRLCRSRVYGGAERTASL